MSVLLAFGTARPAWADFPIFGSERPLAGFDKREGDDVRPQVAVDNDGNWVSVWSSSGDKKSRYGTDSDILFSVSHDTGASWTAPKPINTNALIDDGDDIEPAVAWNSNATWIVVWSAAPDSKRRLAGDHDIVASRSVDHGATWGKPMPLSEPGRQDWGEDSDPDVATDGNGNWVVVWSSTGTLGGSLGSDSDIVYVYSVDNGLTWSAPKPVDKGAGEDSRFDVSAEVDVDNEGNWIVVWSAGEPDESTPGMLRVVLMAKSKNHAKSWSSPRPLTSDASHNTGGGRNPSVAAGDDGAWVVAWASTDTMGERLGHDRDILYSRSGDGGLTWSRALPVNLNAPVDAGDDARARVTYAGRDGWLIAWQSWDRWAYALGADADLMAALSDDNALTWTPPVRVNLDSTTDFDEDTNISVATDRSGNWVAFWQSNEQVEGKLGTDWAIFYSSGHFAARVNAR